MQVIILAAGEGKRIRNLTKGKHKSLLPVNTRESFLSRLLHQLNEYEICKLIVVTGYQSESIRDVVCQFQLNTTIVQNNMYKEDVNIYSMKLALDELNENETTIVIEADIYLDDLALKQIYFESKKEKSIWFTRGKFQEDQYGGILKVDENSNVKRIDIVKRYEEKLEEYYKLLGITTIGKSEQKTFKKLVNEYVSKTIKQYYLIPWIENLDILPCSGYDLPEDLVTSFNKEEEYYTLLENLKNKNTIKSVYDLVNINELYPIEDYIEERALRLKKKIQNDGFWTKPIIADEKNKLVMDGHHRLIVAKKMELKRIPVIYVNYDDIPIWSLTETEIVSYSLVRKRALKGDIYPFKTVKHRFNFEVGECKIPLAELKKDFKNLVLRNMEKK